MRQHAGESRIATGAMLRRHWNPFRVAVIGLAFAAGGAANPEGALVASPVTAPVSSPEFMTVCVNGNIWTDGGFEATDATTLVNPNYPVVFSTHFPTGHPPGTPPLGTPLCNVGNSDCQDGTNGLLTPRTGSAWAWFGGNHDNDGVVEIAYAEQTITFPPVGSSVTLDFYLRVGVVTSPFTDTLEVQVDGTTVPGGTFTEPPTAEVGYTLRTIDLTAFADGAAHAIRFYYTQATPADNNKANFDVDDVTLDIVCGASPTALAVDSSGNGILEPNETVDVKPTWTNYGAASVALTGVSSGFNGPVGPTYDNPDTNADYGTIVSGASANCAANCYSVHITSVSRPATHWDATIDETVSPTSTLKEWTLHVGNSFGDVPHDGFYPFIETIFHNRITGGCGGGNYCPTSPITRAQMAVFILVGEHGAGYTPPACSATLFTDEPCPGGPFVDWVNQLVAEGITAGCGGGKYCPNNAVTRGEMAVFLLVGEHGSGYAPPACSATLFTDEPCPGGPFVDWVNQLVAEGITAGCGSGKYCPNQPNTRGEMAVFITTTFGLLLYGP